MPSLIGSTTPSTAFAAIAASAADPPRASTSAPACDARVWLVATIPNFEITMERACDRSCGETGSLLINSTPAKTPILLSLDIEDTDPLAYRGAGDILSRGAPLAPSGSAVLPCEHRSCL